ncbi:hypothetical protein [Moraxella lacunata]|uniref:hypothetical protein n=1 Tax=Moraxella lacunata TaxID=477 RepID=UPI003EE0463A
MRPWHSWAWQRMICHRRWVMMGGLIFCEKKRANITFALVGALYVINLVKNFPVYIVF